MSKVETAGPKLEGMTYRIVKPLGNGAGSSIFQINDTRNGGYYALKVVKRQEPEDDVYVAQALHEFEVAQRLGHANILKIHDCRAKRAWFKTTGVELLMEYVDGRTLDDLEAPTRGQLVLIFIQVASALAHMHRRGVYHGDIKPSNLMVSKGGTVKVIDFGTAWIKGEPKERIQGTPQYMAPEQLAEKMVDDRTDIYNFGATMYKLITGHFANLGMPSGGELGHRAKPTPPVQRDRNIPGTLSEVIMACLEPSPDRRPAGLAEIKHKLEAVAKYMGVKPDDLKTLDDEDE